MKTLFSHNKVTVLFLLCFLWQCNAKKNIVDSNDIQEIESYLKSAHPDDPKKPLLKSKVIALKNAAWVKGAKDAKPMAVRPIIIDIPKKIENASSPEQEAEEYKRLIASTPEEQRNKTVLLLNKIFDTDISNNEAILLFQNNSDCNIIIRLQDKIFYNLAVPAHGENSLVIKKGNYTLNSNVCDVKYSSTKEISKSQVIILNNPTYADSKPSRIIPTSDNLVAYPKKTTKGVKKGNPRKKK